MIVTPGMAKRRELVVLDDGRVVRLLAVGMNDSLSPLPRRRRVAAGMVKVELPGGAILNRRLDQVVQPYDPGQNLGQTRVGQRRDMPRLPW